MGERPSSEMRTLLFIHARIFNQDFPNPIAILAG
jgi:hypothetical protein